MGRTWQFWIDRGGTFTDVIGLDPDGRMHVSKVLSAADGADPGIRAALQMCRRDAGSSAGEFKIGTTVATNALLQRAGEPVALVTTRGFRDALIIGSQHRPDLFAFEIRRPAPLFERVLEVTERVGAAGQIVTPLDLDDAERQLRQLRRDGLRSLAIVLLHGWRFHEHERALAQLARRIGFEDVSVSHELVPLVRFVPRGETTVVNAYLAPVLRRYVSSLQAELQRGAPGARLHFMQSSGGLAEASRFAALNSVLSGPAGGLIGVREIGRRGGIARLIGFDMGGTSTDVALLDGDVQQRYDNEIAGARLCVPMLDIHTIAAGGGSVLRVADGRYQVGPGSAGAAPGPACYGRGGPATLTDLQLLLGRLQRAWMPQQFGADGRQAVDPAAARAAISALLDSGEAGATLESLAESFLAVAETSMANAIRHVSTGRGLDPAGFALVAFGGAAGQYACRVAERCDIARIIVHPLASVLSAFGIGVAEWLEVRRETLDAPFDDASLAMARERFAQLEIAAEAALTAQQLGPGRRQFRRVLEMRAARSDSSIDVPGDDALPIVSRFVELHRRRFGFVPPATELRIDALRIEVRHQPALPAQLSLDTPPQQLPPRASVWFGGWTDVPVVAAREVCAPIAGPALIVEPHSTFVLERGWSIEPAAAGALLARHAAASRPARPTLATRPAAQTDPAQLEIFNNLFMHIAEQMGAVLQQTAQSVNIRERLDFSCAVFDGQGALVANAPHMPVHLGSMGVTVRALLGSRGGRMSRGDAWMVNSPFHGGTHLPDITVVSPVFCGDSAAPEFFVASRAHHADIGGMTPGSMPPFSTRLDQEGVLFADFELVHGGELQQQALLQQLGQGPWPARNPAQNLADLKAQLAANACGIAGLERAVAEHGVATVRRQMQAVQENAAECVRAAIVALRSGEFRCEMDAGMHVQVRIDVDPAARRARIDFTGTSPAGVHNFNAPRAVCVAAVLYVFRMLAARPIPLNEGCLAPLTLVIPPGSLLDPPPGSAVVAGNVETSQIIVDALLGALGLLAASQGTMNNLTFGDDSLQYYETIAGGSGAGRGFAGCDAVQTHMTNSRLTDPEIFESRFPVRLQQFAIRRGSGGAGRWRGGDGVLRRIEFLARLDAAMLANRRRIAPHGLGAGGVAAPGITRLLRVDGSTQELAASAAFAVEPGDVLEVQTPGGGGSSLAAND